MALDARARDWMGAASGDALEVLRREVERLGGEVASLRSLHEQSEARQGRDLEAVRDEVHALADRFDAQADRVYATADDVAEVARGVEGAQGDLERLRIKLSGVAEKLRWESDGLRKALAAAVERFERGRKTT